MAILRRAVFVGLLIVLVLLAGVFAYINPDPIDIDVGLVRLEQVPMAAAFTAAVALGWVLGIVSAGLALLRMAGDRRRLRRDLRFAEAELSSLRSLPLQDAN